jgi:hypothetical protein
MVLPALAHGGYSVETRVNVGSRFGGGKHLVDVVATRDSYRFLISLKWQQVSGTAEQKVPFEAMCLAQAVLDAPGLFSKAYLVLGGGGWKLRDFFVSGGLEAHLRHPELVDVVTLEQFIALANSGKLQVD